MGQKKRTVIVNLFAGPGCGKSTLAPRLFSDLSIKQNPFGETLLVQEYAKELIYQKRYSDLSYQPGVTRVQADRVLPFVGFVDLIITDSPIQLGLIYGDEGYKHEVAAIIREVEAVTESINIFIDRMDYSEIPYDVRGRIEDQDEALEIDEKIKQMLLDSAIPFVTVKNTCNVESVIECMIGKISKFYTVDPIFKQEGSYDPEISNCINI
jgi:hypothetical protein